MTLSLPDSQIELMQAVVEIGKPVIICLLGESAIDMSYAVEHFQAVSMNCLWAVDDLM